MSYTEHIIFQRSFPRYSQHKTIICHHTTSQSMRPQTSVSAGCHWIYIATYITDGFRASLFASVLVLIIFPRSFTKQHQILQGPSEIRKNLRFFET